MMKLSTAVARILNAALMSLAGAAIGQQAYPTKPIRVLIPFPPGGSTTVVARIVGQKLSENWGQQVIVDNRPGGNGVIGSEALVKSPPDGHTVLLFNNTHAINAVLIPKLPYDSIKDFAPVTTVYSLEFVLALHPSVPSNTVQELISLAKSRPGQLNYASGDSAGVTHLTAELFNIMTGVRMQNIPYKGSGPVIVDLIGGQVQLTFVPPIVAIPHIKTGKLKAIAVSGGVRLAALPQVPTFTEAGLPGFDVKVWNGIVAPAGTPREIIDRLSTQIAKVMAIPEIREKLVSQGLEPFVSSADQFAALIKADIAKYAKIIKTANISFEN